MKRILVIIILAFVFSACKRESNPVFPVPSSEYFPLEAGNRWIYRWINSNEQWTCEITGTKIIGSYLYFISVRTFPDDFKDTSYFRADTNNVVYINFQNEDFIYIDFNRPEGEEWESYANFYGMIRQRGLTVDVDAGTFNNVTEVLIDNRLISDLYEFNHYAPNVGLIQSTGFRRASVLVSAFVNGISYP